MAPVKNIAGPPAGLWWLTAVRKGFHCSKMVKTRRFWIKFGRRAGDSYSDVVLALIFSLMVFCEPRERCRVTTLGTARTPWGFEKKGQKVTKKVFFSQNLFFFLK